MEELKDYEVTELSNTSVGIYRDYLFNHFNDGGDVISLLSDNPKDKVVERNINRIFRDLDIVNTIKLHINEIIYYGSYSIKIDWDKEKRKWVKYELANPYNIVTVRRQGSIQSNLVMSRDQKIYSVAPNSIIRFGRDSLHLINDMNESFFDQEDADPSYLNSIDNKDTLIKRYDLSGGFPLYYNIIGKIKEYLLKDQLVSLLSIKDLIQPLLLLVRVDKATDPIEANKLALTTENLINKYSDLSAIFGANFSILDLMDSILNNIRVLPDYQSAMGDMNSIDLSKISSKIQDIKADLDNLKEAIYTSLGIPRALFAGDTTKWEAIKASQRLNSKVLSMIQDLTDSVRIIAARFYYLLTGTEIGLDKVSASLFTKTDIDYNASITSSEIVSQLVESINRILESVQRFSQDSKLIKVDGYVRYVVEQLKTIDPDILSFIDEETIKKYVEDVLKERNNPDSGNTGFGGSY